MQFSPAILGLLGVTFLVGGGVGFLTGSATRPAVPIAASDIIKSGKLEAAKPALIQSKVKPRPRKSPDAVQPITLVELKETLQGQRWLGWGIHNCRVTADLQNRLAVSDLDTLVAQLALQPDFNHTEFSLIFDAYGERDVEKAMVAANSLKTKPMREMAIVSLLGTLSRSDPERTLAILETIEQPDIKTQMKQSALLTLAEQDPSRAIGMLNSGSKLDYDTAARLFSRLAEKDMDLAKFEANQLTGGLKEQAVSAIVTKMVAENPAAAWEYAKTLNSYSPIGGSTLNSVIQFWTQKDPQAAMEAAMSVPDMGDRIGIAAGGIARWANQDFPAALNYMKSLTDSTIRAEILSQMCSSSSGNSRVLLSLVLEQMPSGDKYQQAISTIFFSWALKNPADAAAALKEIPLGRAHSLATGRVVESWARERQNSAELLSWIQQLPKGQARIHAYASAFGEWVRNDPQDAIQKFSGLPEADRLSTAASIATTWGRSDPEAAVRWASTLPQAAARTAVVEVTVKEWAQIAPAAAAKYVAQMPVAQQARMIPSLVSSWAGKDTEAAAAWVRPLPAGVAKDAAIESLVGKISMEDFEGAIAWTGAIQNEAKRGALLEDLASSWIVRDPDRARAWISSSPLSPETREALLK